MNAQICRAIELESKEEAVGCDIDYFLDHDFIGLSAQEFLEEFKRRVAPLSVTFTGFAESPYARNDWNPNGWSLYCWEHDFETAFKKQEIDLLLSLNGKYIGWTIKLFNKAFCLEVFDDDLSFVLGRRWWQFREFYLEVDDNESSERVNRTIEEIRSKIVPIFHSKKLLVIGDQWTYEIISDDMFEGKSMEEALQNEQIEKDGYKLKICRHGEQRPFSIHDEELPVWIHEF